MTKICPKCKTENSNSAGFCQTCGGQLGEPTEDKPSGGGLSRLVEQTRAMELKVP